MLQGQWYSLSAVVIIKTLKVFHSLFACTPLFTFNHYYYDYDYGLHISYLIAKYLHDLSTAWHIWCSVSECKQVNKLLNNAWNGHEAHWWLHFIFILSVFIFICLLFTHSLATMNNTAQHTIYIFDIMYFFELVLGYRIPIWSPILAIRSGFFFDFIWKMQKNGYFHTNWYTFYQKLRPDGFFLTT